MTPPQQTPAPTPPPPPLLPLPQAQPQQQLQMQLGMRWMPTEEQTAAARELLAYLQTPPSTPLPPLPQAQSGGSLPPPPGAARAVAVPAVQQPVVMRELPLQDATELTALAVLLPPPPSTPLPPLAQAQSGGS